jgi:large subunit ribosomal protein L10Ae
MFSLFFLMNSLADSYDVFLASATLINQIPRILGPGLNKAGKFPSPIGANEKLEDKV